MGKLFSLSGSEALNMVFDQKDPARTVQNMTRVDLFWLMKNPLAVPLSTGATINGEPISGLENNTLTIWEDDFVGFNSSDTVYPDFRTMAINYTWTFHDGSVSYSPDTAYRYTKKGEYEVVLMVRTYDDYTDIARVNIIVSNRIPMAYPGYTKIVGTTVYFNGSESEDTPSDMAGLSYFWDFGDGETATGCDAVHTYGSKDVYYATLTVTDDDGASSAVTIKVDLGGDAEFSLATYYPAVAGIFLLVVLLALYFYMQRGNSKSKEKCEKKDKNGDGGEERVAGGPRLSARKPPLDRTSVIRTPPGRRPQVGGPPVRTVRKRF